MEMCHGESQEEGQEESQEEIVLAWNTASERLSRSPLNSKTMPAQAGIVVFGTQTMNQDE
jgi:hypothetical protein